jgi:hypothetical protein
MHFRSRLVGLSALLTVGSAQIVWSPNDLDFDADASLCYRVEWAGGAMAGIRPISGMPAAHPLVNGDVNCPGYTFSPGAPIPAIGHWPRTGRCNTLRSMSGAQMFYGHNYPVWASANTGYYRRETATMYMIEDAVGDVYLVFTLDAPASRGDTSGGRFYLDVATSPPQHGIELVLLDDPNEYENSMWTQATRDGLVRHGRWNASVGRGSFAWAWGPCCTDVRRLQWRSRDASPAAVAPAHHTQESHPRIGRSNRAAIAQQSITLAACA